MEKSIIARAQQGDKEAYRELVLTYAHVVEKFAYQIGVHENDIGDVAQEVFLKLYRFLHQFNDSRFTTWLYKITLNTARDFYRKEARETKKEQKLQQQDAKVAQSAESRVLVYEEDQQLHAAIQLLKEDYRMPLILFYFHQLQYDEIAEVLGITLANVKVRIHRAKEQLKAILVKEESAYGR